MVTPTDELYGYNFDAIGSTIAMTDDSGQIVNAYAYTPFGRITNKQETISQPFTFVGQHGVMTEPNGLYYMRARYYDPQTGRFISQDPLGFDGGDVNLYIYAANNPVLLIDPNGEFNWVGAGIGLFSGAISGFAAGAKAGNIKAGILGGLAGAAAGTVVGLALPSASSGVGAAIGGAIAGAFGGGVGGGTATAISGGGALDIAKSVGEGVFVGAVSGAVGGAAGHLAKIGMGARAATLGGQFGEAWVAGSASRIS